MIVIRLWGGIGNQLFQYVFGEYLRYRYNQEVKYDDGSYNGVDILRKRELDILRITIEYDSSYSFSQCRGLKNRVLRTLFNLTPKKHLIIEDSTKLPTNYKKGHIYYFQGYWQSIEYCDWLRKNIPSFELKSKVGFRQLEPYRNLITMCEESVSLHIRRGDYFTPQNIKTYGVCTEYYYHKALDYILNSLDKRKIFVFSDDIEWVKNHIKLPGNSVIIPNYDIPQFMYIELMSLCKHHIISNSTFSWWGDYLSENKEKITIAPSCWFLNKKNPRLYNDKWILISHGK